MFRFASSIQADFLKKSCVFEYTSINLFELQTQDHLKMTTVRSSTQISWEKKVFLSEKHLLLLSQQGTNNELPVMFKSTKSNEK